MSSNVGLPRDVIHVGIPSWYRYHERTVPLLQGFDSLPVSFTLIDPVSGELPVDLPTLLNVVWSFYPSRDGTYSRRLSEKCNVPFVMTMRGQFWHQDAETQANAVRIYREAAHITTLADHMGTQLVQRWPELASIPRTVIPNGNFLERARAAAPCDLASLGVPEGRRLVAHVTNHAFEGKRRATDELIDAWRELAPKDATLAIAARRGRFAYSAEDVLNFPEGVIHLGEWRWPMALMLAADAFLYASWIDGQASVIMEALSAGAPVVAYRGLGNEEIVIDGVTGLLFDDPAEGIECVCEVLKRPELAAYLVANAERDMRTRFSWKRVAGMYYNVFREVINAQ